MRITLCTWDTPDYADLAAVSQPGKEEYCARHGYKFVHDQRPLYQPHLGFERMAVVQELLGHNDLVLSVDTDAMMMNHTLKAERLYREGKGLVISEDLFGLNDGVFAAFNTTLTHQFFSVYLTLAQQNGANSQALMRHLLDLDLYRDMVVKVPQREINAYRNLLYNRPPWFTGNYEPGDWICQYPGMTKEARIPLMLEAQKSVIR